MRIFLILFILLIIGCSQFKVDSQSEIDSEFIPYLMMYKSDKLNYLNTSKLRNMDIIFRSLVGRHGRCVRFNTGYRKIEIDPSSWFSFNNDEKLLLLYHELGHCDLGFNHTTNVSIMNTHPITGSDFITNKSYYLNLFFYKGQ